jgi:hypothetical protein
MISSHSIREKWFILMATHWMEFWPGTTIGWRVSIPTYNGSFHTTCNACVGEGVLATGRIFRLAGRDHPLIYRSSTDWRTSPEWQASSIEICSSGG